MGATLDQLTQEPDLVKSRGFVGRRIGSGVTSQDRYIAEPTAQRSNYQLEPGVVFLKTDTNQVQDAITYPGFLDALAARGAFVEQQDRIFSSEYYAWDSFCDIDKLINYSQYYWLPYGPDAVDVLNTDVPLTRTFEVTRLAGDAYRFSFYTEKNPKIRLVRGGNYQFELDQPGNGFYIQAAPGISGTMPYASNISSRDVLGVINNGEDQGTVTFNVPLKTAQDFFYNLTDIGTVDLVTDLRFDEINNVYVDVFLAQFPNGIDEITNLNGRTLIFTNRTEDAVDGGWQITSLFDPLPRADSFNGVSGSFDSLPYSFTQDIVSQEERYSIYRVNYVNDADDRPFMQLELVRNVPLLSKFAVTFGQQGSNTQWYKDATGYFEQIPLLTATQDILYYQDATDNRLFGQIELIDPDLAQPLDINDIVGAQDYVSPNGIVFTNGLKVRFTGEVTPASYQNREYYIEGVGSGPGIAERVGFVDGEAYYGAFHTHQGQKMTGASHTSEFQQFIYATVDESVANRGAGSPAGAPLPVQGVPGAVAGNGIRLVPITDLITPEPYTRSATIPYDSTAFDDTPFDSSLNAPTIPDYLTVNRSSADLNAWARSNRWFHVDVIRDTARYTNQDFVIDNVNKARRPIIEFRANLRLFDNGTQGIGSVSLVDFAQTDALSNVAGQTQYTIDGVDLADDMRVIFGADQDPQVRNRIFRVEMIDPDGDSDSPKVINLVDDSGTGININDCTVTTTGLTGQGTSYYFDGVNWNQAQQKINVNQAPLFDVFDNNGRSLSDPSVYPSSSFAGSRLFGYADSASQTPDPILGFSLRYLNINNIGDILFRNYFFNESFVFVDLNNRSQTRDISVGLVRQYQDRVSFSSLIGWIPAAVENISRQVVRFVYNDEDLIFDVEIKSQTSLRLPAVKIYADGEFVDRSRYQVINSGETSRIQFSNPPRLGAAIETQIISDQISTVGFYQVPSNLENNALNQNSENFTLGTLRRHYESIVTNLVDLSGEVNGANNSRDLGNILSFGQDIVQHSSPLSLAGVFLRREQYEIFDALRFNAQEYEKYKARLLDAVTKLDIVNLSVNEILDQTIAELAEGRTEQLPFYWSDMLPSGETFDETLYTVTPITTKVFTTSRTYDFTASNYQGLLVYLNGNLLTINRDYTVSTASSTIDILVELVVGDTIRIREYSATYGSYVPNTPSKMGLYPAWQPSKYLDSTYTSPTQVIKGHDGSITVCYGDIRDQILLEFETRIYNNLKIKDPVPLVEQQVMPGRFRSTDYTLSETTQILSSDFLSWVGWNRLDYTLQTYSASNEFTWNYSQSGDRISGAPLLGAWRGIYRYFYDTLDPTRTPWEMLGFSEKPTWWENTYGPAPYTEGNLVLWEDLANGIIADPQNPRIAPMFVRPDLLDVIPAASEGQLLAPLQAVVGNYDSTSFRRSWTFGDGGPVENAWRSSSSYPFAVMRLLALTKPAKFFSLFADRDRYRFNTELNQYLWDNRYRLDAKTMGPFYGSGVSKASYLNWIIDYNRTQGINTTKILATDLANIDVRLCWRVAGYTDKRYLKIYTERSTPSGENLGFLLPDESYQLLLYDNVPQARSSYSAVIIQKTASGYKIQGYDITRPYFVIKRSRVRGKTRSLQAGSVIVAVPVEYTNDTVAIPYGYTFNGLQAVCDFLLSYGQHLTDQGFEFSTKENGYIMDWAQMCQEFLYWSNQGWIDGSLINLNPAARALTCGRSGLVARSLVPASANNLVLNQNRQTLTTPALLIDRDGNGITLTSQNSDAISYATMQWNSFEHVIVLDNRSLFADLIYDPSTGARQNRVLVSGWVTGSWDGTVNAPGFVLNQDNIEAWQPGRIYTKGDIVIYKDRYWSARQLVQPREIFQYVDWLSSDYALVKKGLLPNAATSSVQLADAYDINVVNLESDINLLSYGLIGFRPRTYMQSLSLDDVSQVNLYRQFLGSKGTRRSAEIFSFADIGKETAQYDIYEYWAMLKAQYGATANRRYIEILLNQSLLYSDPGLIQVIEPQQASDADQTVLVQDLYKTSYKVTSPDLFVTAPIMPGDFTLPTAGYVNIDDIDFSVFDIDSISELTTDDDIDTSNLARIGEGTTIWVAKVNDTDWNVYRCQSIDAQIVVVSDNLDGTVVLTFDRQHGLQSGDPIIIKYFDASVNGTYRVIGVLDLYNITIGTSLPANVTQLSGTGLAFKLVSARVAQPADIADLPEAKDLRKGTKVWVDNIGDGRWGMLENTDPWTGAEALTPRAANNQSNYGTAMSQGLRNLTALIGAPDYYRASQDGSTVETTGAVYVFVRQANDEYAEDTTLLMNTANVSEFGASIDLGNDSYAVIGAPGSAADMGYALIVFTESGQSSLQQKQILIPSDGDYTDARFGQQVTTSQDERWIYVSAPGTNKVYAYNRVDISTQSITYLTDGSTYGNRFNYDQHCVIDSSYPDQLSIGLDSRILQPGTDFTLDAGDLILTAEPDDGQILSIQRREVTAVDQFYYYAVQANVAVPFGGAGAEFTVDVRRGIYNATVTQGGDNYSVGDVLTIYGTSIGGASPANDLQVAVTQTGNIYNTTTEADSGSSLIYVSTVEGLDNSGGQDIYQIGGSGSFAANTLIISVNTDNVTAVEITSGEISNTAVVRSTVSIGNVANVGGVYYANTAPLTVDGVTLLADDQVLVLNQTDLSENGLYKVLTPGTSNNGSWQRLLGGISIDQQIIEITGPLAPLSRIPEAENMRYKDTLWQMTTFKELTLSDPVASSGSLAFFVTPGPVSGIDVLTPAAGIGNTASFDLRPSFYQIDDIYSFTVVVDGEIYVPQIDYTLSGTVLTFSAGARFPVVGAAIGVRSSTHFKPVDVITASSVGASNTAGFGTSISTTSDGRQLVISAPVSDFDTYQNAGNVYVLDRSVQAFIYLDDSDSQFITALPQQGPVTVKLNGVFLTKQDGNVSGNFTTSGSDIVTIIDPALTAGDQIEVETNSFRLIQVMQAGVPSDFAQFGFKVDACVNDCSLYASAPYDSSQLSESGMIEFWNNQARVYGSIVTESQNPVLSPGDTLSVNGIYVQLSQPAAWTDTQVWSGGVFVIDGSSVYQSLSMVPANTDISDTRYWRLSSWVEVLAADITQPVSTGGVPNVSAAVSNGYLRLSVKNAAAASALNKLSILPGTGTLFDDLGVPVYARLQEIRSPRPEQYSHFGWNLFISDDTRTLAVAAPDGSMIKPMTLDLNTTTFDSSTTKFSDTVLQSGQVYLFDQLSAANATVDNANRFVFGQQIVDQNIRSLDRFGASLDLTTGVLLIGAPGNDTDGSTDDNIGRVSQFANPEEKPAWTIRRLQQPSVDVSLFNRAFTYDRITSSTQTFFDFFDPLQGKLLGVVSENIDYIAPIDPAAYNIGPVNNYGNFWAGDKVGHIWWDINNVRYLDPNQNDLGYASRRWGQIFPGSTVQVYQWVESRVSPGNYTGPGEVRNTANYTVRSRISQEGIIETVYYFWVTDIDTVAQLQGKSLSINSLTRYIADPRSSGLSYLAAINSSTVAIYNALSLIQSLDTVLHIDYDQQLNDSRIHTEYQLIPAERADGFLNQQLYQKMIDSFSGIDDRGAPVPDPNLAPNDRYGVQIRPRQSFFVDRIKALQNYLVAANRVLADFPVSENRRFSLLNSSEPEPSAAVRRILINQRTMGNGTDFLVVDVAYSLVTAVSLQVNGLNVVITDTNIVSADGGTKTQINFPQVYTVTDTLNVTLVGADWNKHLDNYVQLTYQDISAVVLGYRYLVASDENNNGLWTIYEVIQGPTTRELLLSRVQTYDTRNYWEYINWYRPGFDPASRVTSTVANTAALDTINVPTGSVVKVLGNAQGKFEIYTREIAGWQRVALEDGTIRFKNELWDYQLGRFGFDIEVFDAQYYDENPFVETRQIIRAINEELFIDDLLLERNKLLVLTFRYIMSEQTSPGWLSKTSLIDINHVIRELIAYPVYRRDNQNFVIDYIQEVKPYHTQIREFNLKYQGRDSSVLQIADFDLPAYWDSARNLFVSPVLDDSGEISRTSSVPATSPIWQQFPYDQWFNNYTLFVQSVTVVNAGSGYTVTPTVEITGDAVIPAQLQARITSSGELFAVEVINPGSGYVTTPTVTLTGGNGSGARVALVMNNNLVRKLRTTMRFDRYQYQSLISDWQANVPYENGEQVRYANRVWIANGADSTVVQTPSFDPTQWTQLDPGLVSLSYDDQHNYYVPTQLTTGVDRTRGFYAPQDQEVGLDLAQVITGIDYPGVQVQGLDFVRISRYTGDGVTTQFGFSGITIPEDRRVPKQRRVQVKVNGLIQRLDLDYSITFAPNRIDFVNAPAVGSTVTINQLDPFAQIGDVIYASEFDDSFLGVLPAPAYSGQPVDSRSYGIEVDGGGFVDTYSSHAPEELLPGAMFDTLDFKVYQTPGADWEDNGHGFNLQSRSFEYDSTQSVYSWQGLIEYPVSVLVYNSTDGYLLTQDQDYELDWAQGTIEIVSGVNDGQAFLVQAAELGGGNQIWRSALAGDVAGSSQLLPVNFDIIQQVVVFVNGIEISGSTLTRQSPSQTLITFPNSFDASDLVVLVVMSSTTNNNYTWSVPLTEWFVSDGALSFDLSQAVNYSNPTNLIVTLNGRRVRPWESVSYTSDDTTLTYELPNNGDIDQGLIADNDVLVYVDDLPQILNQDYVVDPFDGSSQRTVTLAMAPASGARIVVSVRTASPYLVTNNQLVFKSGVSVRPIAGDIVGVTSFNDTREQDLLTQVWQGPTQTVLSVLNQEGFDSLLFDPNYIADPQRTGDLGYAGSFGIDQAYEIRTIGTTDFTSIGAPDNNIGTIFVATGAGTGTGTAYVIAYSRSVATDSESDTSGSWDFSTGIVVSTNRFDTGSEILQNDRVKVTLDGRWLVHDQDYTIDGSVVIIGGPIIGGSQIVAVTSMTQSVLPGEMKFRIFQNMRGQQTTYRITKSTTTVLTENITSTSDSIAILDASRLSAPDLENNIFGLCMIDGEQIAYRSIDLITNTISGLRRGVAGTAAASHASGAEVTDMGAGNILFEYYQDRVNTQSWLDPVNTVEFVNPLLTINDSALAYLGGIVSVLIDGELQATSSYTLVGINPVVIVLDVIPPVGTRIDVNVLQISGVSQTTTFTANGNTPNFTTDIVMVLQQQSSVTVVRYDPITVAFAQAPANNQVVLVTTQNTYSESASTFAIGDGATTVFSGISDLARPVLVDRGGSRLASASYSVTDIAPITIELAQPLPPGQQLDVSLRQGRVWYKSGIDAPSDGLSLQVTDNRAARFLRDY